MLRHGLPGRVFCTRAGVGDDLLATAPLRELRRRQRAKTWFLARSPALFAGNPHVDLTLQDDLRYENLCSRLGSPVRFLHYLDESRRTDPDRDPPPRRHIIAEMSARAGLTGEVDLRPWIFLSDAERTAGRRVERQAVIQSSILGAGWPIRNKEWFAERFQQVVENWRGRLNFVQLGAPQDPPLSGVVDLRGKTSLREAAGLLSQSEVFVGLCGFLMHLARAAEVRAAIVYGGRESPDQSGYACNENIFTALPCSPCWQVRHCDYQRICMERITADDLSAAIERVLAKRGQPLEAATATLP